MTISLGNVGQRFESTFKTDAGFPFPGVILPLNEGSPSLDFITPRWVIRIRETSPVITGAVILDPANRRFLMGNADTGIADNEILYRTHILFPATHQMTWEREVSTIDPLTQLKRTSSSRQDLGTMWVMQEQIRREPLDLTMRVKEETHKVVTNMEVLLNDIVDNRIVKRIDNILGLYIIELQ